MLQLYCYIVSRLKSEEGAALTEYALLVALIAVVSITILTTLGTTIATKFGQIVTAL